MLKLLLKKQLFEIFSPYFYDAKKNKARSKISAILYFSLFILLVIGVLGGIFTFLSVKLCMPLISADLNWLYFALMGLISIALGTFGSVFNTYAGLYLPKDNDLLLSMPIPVSSLLAARLFSVYLMGLMYSAVVILPTDIVYFVIAGLTPSSLFGSLAFLFQISAFVLLLSCILGYAVSKISLKLKHKSVMTVLISVTFIALYYFVYFKAQSFLQDLLINAAVYGNKIKRNAYLLYLFGEVGLGDTKATGILLILVIALFCLMWRLLSHSFLHIVTSTGKGKSRKYQKNSIRCHSVNTALLGRELAHFTADSSYMLNCGLGAFLMPVCAIFLLWKGRTLFAVLNVMFIDTAGSVSLLICVMLCGLASMNFMATPSVSLEGKSLWIMQSLPVNSWKVLQSKVQLQFLLTALPLLLCVTSIAIVCPLPVMHLFIIVLFAVSYTLLAAMVCLTLGLKMPVLTWTNKLMLFKQSAPVIFTLLGGICYTILLFAGFFLLPGWTIGFSKYMACFISANVILCAGNYLWLLKKGTKRFETL